MPDQIILSEADCAAIAERLQRGDGFQYHEISNLLATIAALREALGRYGVHERECILAHWEAGEPTASGGYQMKYRGVWYEVRPTNTLAPCTRGLDAALRTTEKEG